MNMDMDTMIVLESDGTISVCASIEGVTEIERGFDGNFQFITDEDLTGKENHIHGLCVQSQDVIIQLPVATSISIGILATRGWTSII